MRTPAIAALATFALLAGCGQADETPPTAAAPEAPPVETERTVLDAARENPEFSTWAALASEAGLAERLEDAGPVTLFIPTNAAFEKLPAAQRRALHEMPARPALVRLLSRHVVPGRLTQQDIAERAQAEGGAASLATLGGGALILRERDGRWTVRHGDAVSVIAMPDVIAADGVIHAVDTVLTENQIRPAAL